MNWDDLRFALAISRAGSISTAAKVLKVNATTVARRLKAMEKNYNVLLFQKQREGTVLTDAGQKLVEAAESMEALTHDLDAHIEGLDTQLEGIIRVTCTDFFLNHWISDLAEFHQTYPGIELEFITSYEMSNLSKREADIAIRISHSAPPHLIGRAHANARFAVYGSESIINSIGHDAPYSAFPWISWEPSAYRGRNELLDAKAKGAQVVMRLENAPLIASAIESGIGISILACILGDKSPNLRRIGSDFEGGYSLWVLTHPDLRASARVSVFTQFIRGLIERDKDLIEGRCGIEC
jgi:molybdate transport repressor ModE-like protein